MNRSQKLLVATRLGFYLNSEKVSDRTRYYWTPDVNRAKVFSDINEALAVFRGSVYENAYSILSLVYPA